MDMAPRKVADESAMPTPDVSVDSEVLRQLLERVNELIAAVNTIGAQQQWVTEQAAVAQTQLQAMMDSGGGIGGLLKMAKSIAFGGKAARQSEGEISDGS